MSTINEEVWLLVQEWYANHNLPISFEDSDTCLTAIEEERLSMPLQTIQAIQEQEKQKQKQKQKPSYGSPEFWKAYWAKKRAKA